MNTEVTEEITVKQYAISRNAWESALLELNREMPVYAPVIRWQNLDYEPITRENLALVRYNTPKPVSPLKLFLLPVKENVVRESDASKPFIVIGSPACDLYALDLLDLFYLNEDYIDPYYQIRRKNMILIGTDCHSVMEHCHCTSYGLNPFPVKNQD
ncbi:MAG: hypothetical protein R6V49_01315, partial [Bacteroidales bacterium]